MNSIPFHGHPSQNPDVYVYIGVDGLSYSTTEAALKNGDFQGSDWKLSKLITGFPGTSDASWTRILHTQELDGYELAYYDPESDSIKNRGIGGILEHVAPALSSTIDFTPHWMRTFDFWANDYLHILQAYQDTYISYADSIDNLFSLLEGRAETSSVFFGYILELDVLGHMQSSTDVGVSLRKLADKINTFRNQHPERNFHFTLFSDHGLDFIPVGKDHLVQFEKELEKVGVTPVISLKSHNPKNELFAAPVVHTRVTYMALHTHPDLRERVAKKASQIPSADLVITRLKKPPSSFLPQAEWFGIWKEGKQIVSFGFDPQEDLYLLPQNASYQPLGIEPKFSTDTNLQAFSDSELFELTKDSIYPDLFYRIRTSLSPVGCRYPADVLISLRPGYVCAGFQIIDGGDTLSAHNGFHGALEYRGTLGTLLTEEKEIPTAVRSDNLLELFPRLKENIRSRGIQFVPGDPNASL